MRAIRFDSYGGPDVLHLVEVARPEPGPGMVRLRVRAAAVNPADPKWRAGMFDAVVPVSHAPILGYDIAGTVDSLGAGVTGLAIGDRVFGMLSHLDKGGYAEFAVLATEQAVPIPEGLDFATAAAIPTAGLTGVQVVEEHVRPAAGETVLITGATGAVGRFAVHAAVALGARVVAAVRPEQIAEARALGAGAAFALGETWSGEAFDHVVDTVGGPEVGMLCRHVKAGGRICTVATTPIPADGLPTAPAFVAVHHDPARLAALAEAVARGLIAVPIAARLPLESATAAHRLVEAGGAGGKVVLEP